MVTANPAVWEEESQWGIRQRDTLSATLKSRAKPFSHIRDVKVIWHTNLLASNCSHLAFFQVSHPDSFFIYVAPEEPHTFLTAPANGYFPLSVPTCLYLCFGSQWLSVSRQAVEAGNKCQLNWVFSRRQLEAISPHITGHLHSSGCMLSFCFPATTGFSTLCYSFEETRVLAMLATRAGKKPSESIQITSAS